MNKNMGSADRIIRIALALIFATLYFTSTVTGTVGLILLIVGGVFVLTSLVSFCPLYTLFGIKTCAVKESGKV
ncbi:MAG TPA: DUF2892 domain-containing protein [Cytophagales bacterium]|nr:DUF2892 domain-containing protein [Cytophagales bacterium]HRG10845.1 DUF2892 domain-containing protein [Cyclobacteriaceae bacterium]